MISIDDVQNQLGRGGVVLDSDGSKIGKIGQIYLDNETGEPEWVTVSTGLFGTSESFVPLRDASLQGDDIQVPYGKKFVSDAPRVEADGEITPGEEAELYSYYGVNASSGQTTVTGDSDGNAYDRDDATLAGTSGRDRVGDTDAAGHDTSGPNTDDAMTRSEERLDIGKTSVATGKARLRKYIVTENVTQTVPVSREEVRIEREPITDANVGDALRGGDLTEEEHEVTLSAEKVVVNKETVPVERVRLGTETVVEDETVSEQVRKEQIDTDQVPADRADRGRTS